MHESTLFYLTITVFGIIYIWLALLPRKQIKNKTDYFLAGRNLTVFRATCTLIATQLGAGLLLGTSQKAYSMGLYSLLFTFGVSIGLIILGCGVAGKLRALNIATTTQIFESAYNSPFLRKASSLLVTITLCGILIANIVASHSLLDSLGFDSTFFYMLFWFFIILYTMIGGLHAVVLTDLVQVTFIVVVFVGLTFYALWQHPPVLSLHALRVVQQQFTGHLPDLNDLAIMLLMPAFFALFEQDLAQIFFASKTRRVATLAAILTTIFMLTFGLIPIYLGMKAHMLQLTVMGDQSPLLTFVGHQFGPVMLVMIAAGILAAIASTADAVLCAIGANITQDFSLSFLGLSPLVESKSTILVMGVAMFALSAFMPTDVITILVRSYEIPVCCLLISIIAAYMRPKVRYMAGLVSFYAGALGLILFRIIFPFHFAAFVALGMSFAGYILGDLWSMKRKFL